MRHLTSHGFFQGFPGCARSVLLEPSTGLLRRCQVGFRVQLKVLGGVLGVSLSSAKSCELIHYFVQIFVQYHCYYNVKLEMGVKMSFMGL